MNKENTILQQRLNDIQKYTEIHEMKVNSKKTKIIPFNFTRKYDFIPDYKINNEQLDVVYSSKLLGVMIQSDCKWGENTKYIVGKAKKRIWFLRRLKKLGASKLILIDAYRNLGWGVNKKIF